MDEKQIEQIRRSLEIHDTEELLEIWRSEDNSEWTDEAVAIAGEILTTRLGELPPKSIEADDDEDEGLDDYLDPRTYNIQKAQNLASQSRVFAKTFLVLILLVVVVTFVAYSQSDQWFNVATLSSMFFALLIPVGSCVLAYILLTAIGYGLDLLADIADNTRIAEKYLAKSLQHK